MYTESFSIPTFLFLLICTLTGTSVNRPRRVQSAIERKDLYRLISHLPPSPFDRNYGCTSNKSKGKNTTCLYCRMMWLQNPPPPPPSACQDRYTIPATQGEEKQGERKGWGQVTEALESNKTTAQKTWDSSNIFPLWVRSKKSDR